MNFKKKIADTGFNFAELDVTGSTALKGWLEKWKNRDNVKEFYCG